jgi:hypothetical protein
MAEKSKTLPLDDKAFVNDKSFLILVLECVSQGDSVASSAGPTELNVVVDEIKIGLGLNKEASTRKHSKSGAYVHQEVVAAGEVRTAESRAIEERLVKADGFPANAALQIGLRPLAKIRRIDRIEVGKDGPIWLEEDIYILVGPPGNLAANTKVLFEKEIAAKGGITAAAQGLWKMVGQAGAGSRFSDYRSEAKAHVELLGLRRSGAQKSHAKSRNEQR